MGTQGIADRARTRGVAPVFQRFIRRHQLAKSLFRHVEQVQARTARSGTCAALTTCHELRPNEAFAVGSYLQVYRRTRPADPLRVAVNPAPEGLRHDRSLLLRQSRARKRCNPDAS